jgi:hypothetical protein
LSCPVSLFAASPHIGQARARAHAGAAAGALFQLHWLSPVERRSGNFTRGFGRQPSSSPDPQRRSGVRAPFGFVGTPLEKSRSGVRPCAAAMHWVHFSDHDYWRKTDGRQGCCSVAGRRGLFAGQRGLCGRHQATNPSSASGAAVSCDGRWRRRPAAGPRPDGLSLLYGKAALGAAFAVRADLHAGTR